MPLILGTKLTCLMPKPQFHLLKVTELGGALEMGFQLKWNASRLMNLSGKECSPSLDLEAPKYLLDLALQTILGFVWAAPIIL